MKPNTAPRTQRGTAPMHIPVNTVDNISFQTGELAAQIAGRAYDCFEARGGKHGDDLGDWLRAEEELVHRVPFHLQELEDRIELELEVAQNDTQNLQVNVDSHQLLVRSVPETAEPQPGEPTSSRQHTLFHVIDLPCDIDVDKVTATLNEGNLRVTLPKQVARNAPTPKPDLSEGKEPHSADVSPAYLETAG